MEKPAAKSKHKILKLLPRAASAITFHNLPFSPGRNKKAVATADKLKSYHSKEFSGPNLSIVRAEAGRSSYSSGYEEQEPTSPKISCMGHIKHRKKMAKNMHLLLLKEMNPFSSPIESKTKPSVMKPVFFLPEAKKIPSRMQNGTLNNLKPGRKSDASATKSTLHDIAPSLSQMKRFASFHGSLANFDWKMSQIEMDDIDESHAERGDSKGEEEAVIPFFAPTMVGEGGPVALEPRKEINLWKRRTMAQPKPIEINTFARIHR